MNTKEKNIFYYISKSKEIIKNISFNDKNSISIDIQILNTKYDNNNNIDLINIILNPTITIHNETPFEMKWNNEIKIESTMKKSLYNIIPSKQDLIHIIKESKLQILYDNLLLNPMKLVKDEKEERYSLLFSNGKKSIYSRIEFEEKTPLKYYNSKLFNVSNYKLNSINIVFYFDFIFVNRTNASLHFRLTEYWLSCAMQYYTIVVVEKEITMKDQRKWNQSFRLMLFSVLLALLIAGCGSSKNSKNVDENPDQQAKQETVVEEPVQATTEEESASVTEPSSTEQKPDPAYDKYAMVDYLVEDIGAEFTATVSAKEDGSEYEVRCTLENEEQVVVLDKNLVIISDKTGNMGYDAPFIVQKAIDENNWNDIEK